MTGRAVFFVPVFGGRLHKVGIGCRNLGERCDAAFWKIADLVIVACAGKIFWEIPGKIFVEIVFGKNLVESSTILHYPIFLNEHRCRFGIICQVGSHRKTILQHSCEGLSAKLNPPCLS